MWWVTSAACSQCYNTNIFKVPEVPKEVVPEKKVAVPKKPEVPPAKGTCQESPSSERSSVLVPTVFNVKLFVSLPITTPFRSVSGSLEFTGYSF